VTSGPFRRYVNLTQLLSNISTISIVPLKDVFRIRRPAQLNLLAY
jgi:hypothetical protein